MRFACIGYFKEKDLEKFSESEQEQFITDYATFFGQIKRDGKLLSGTGLQSTVEGCRLWQENGNIQTSGIDNNKDQIGGIFIIEAQDLEEAKSIVGKHPGLALGWFDIRAVDEELTHAVGVN